MDDSPGGDHVLEEQTAPIQRYRIDIDRINNSGRSFDTLVEQRLCAAALRRLGQEREERVPKVDPKSKKVTFETRTVRLTPSQLIREYCSRERDYLNPDLSVLEIIFRVLLANGNQPISIEELRQQLDEWPAYGDRMRLLTDEALASLIARDRYYGIRLLALPTDTA